MGTWASFYVKTSDKFSLIAALQSSIVSVTDVAEEQSGSITGEIIPSTSGIPDRLILAQINPEWIVVFHNSFDSLEDLVTGISLDLQTMVIVTIAQSVSSYYYFALYNNGFIKREIECCHSDDSESINSGEPFSFENEQPGESKEYDGEVSYFFDFDSLEDYCKHFGFDMYVNPDNCKWTLLQHPQYKSIAKNAQHKKTWWKLW